MTHSSKTVQQQAAGGVRSTLYSQAIRLVCKAGSVVLIARLVSPHDHGLYAMAASVTLFLAVFRDAGLGALTVQTPHIDEKLRRQLGYTHVSLGAFLTALTWASSDAAATAFGQPSLKALLSAMSISFLLIGLGALPRSLLARELQFAALNRVETGGVVAGTAAMLAIAAGGGGAWSFVGFLLVSETTNTVLAWTFCPKTAVASPESSPSLGSLLRRGLPLTQHQLLNFLAVQLEVIAVGKVLGAHVTGLYNRATQLLNLAQLHIAEPLGVVALSALAKLRHDPAEFVRQTRSSANVVAHLTLPVAALAIACPAAVLHAVLGERWIEGAELLRWLAISAALAHVTAVANSVAIACDQGRRLVWSAAATLAAAGLAIVVGLPYGAVGVAQALAGAHVLLAVPRLAWRLAGSPVPLRAYLTALGRPIVAGACLAAGGALGQAAGAAYSQLHASLGAFGGAGLAAGTAFVALPGLRREWSNLAHFFVRPAAP